MPVAVVALIRSLLKLLASEEFLNIGLNHMKLPSTKMAI